MGGSEVQGQPGVQEMLIKTNNNNKMNWGYNLVGRVLAKQEQNPDLNSQYCINEMQGPCFHHFSYQLCDLKQVVECCRSHTCQSYDSTDIIVAVKAKWVKVVK